MYRRTWIVTITTYGFKSKILFYGSERELWAYLRPDFGGDERTTGNYSYSGATEKEIQAAKLLGMPVYICPEI